MKLQGRWGSYEARTPEEKAKARRQAEKRAEANAQAAAWREKHRWCINGCGQEAALAAGGVGQYLEFDGACSAECLEAFQRSNNTEQPEPPPVSQKRRGRPPTGKALSNADRQALYRQRNRSAVSVSLAELEAADRAIKEIRQGMIDQAEAILFKPDLKPHFEKWYRQIHDLQQQITSWAAMNRKGRD